MNKFLSILVIGLFLILSNNCTTKVVNKKNISLKESFANIKKPLKKKKTVEQRALFTQERLLHDFNMQKNPVTNKVTREDKIKESESALFSKLNANRLASKSAITTNSYIFRGPSNFGGRTREVVYDISDATGNTMIAGGVSGGVFRTTNGGASWTKVSSYSDIHNVTCIAQDPRPGFQNIWYYGTGEMSGNSATLGSAYRGQGVWKSTNNGVSWAQVPDTNSLHELYDTDFDYINAIKISPTTGEVFIATAGKIYRYDGITFTIELEKSAGFSTNVYWTDVEIASNGRVFASISSSTQSISTSADGNGAWTTIATTGTPSGINTTGRMVLASAPSNPDIMYALVAKSGTIEANLYQWNQATSTWTDYSSKLPDEPGGDLDGNDPFKVQGGYDLVVSLKPDNENFVVIGGTNAYKIANITTDAMFSRIGGYRDNTDYYKYDLGGGATHHPDVHSLVFNPFNNNVLVSGTDGGVHRTNNITNTTVSWQNLNNFYTTYQYYHVALDPATGSDVVLGGAQDNGTTDGGTNVGYPDLTTMDEVGSGDGVAVEISNNYGTCNLPYILGYQEGGLYNICNGQYNYITPTGSSSDFVTYFYLDPENSQTLYFAGLNRLYRALDFTTVTAGTWNNLGTIANSSGFTVFASTRQVYNSASSFLFIGSKNGKIHRLLDPRNAAAASSATDITPVGATGYVSGISIHPTNPNIVMVTYSNYGVNNIYLSTDATSAAPTWTNVERNLTNHSCRSAMIVEVDGQTQYFVGTAKGLYFTLDPTTTDWTIEAPSTLGLSVISSLRYRPSDNIMLVGTHGNGMFQTLVQKLAVDDLQAKSITDLLIYPNPAKDFITIKFNNSFISKEKYAIIDINGSIVANGIVNDNGTVDVTKLSSGVYFISLNINNKEIANKFIKH